MNDKHNFESVVFPLILSIFKYLPIFHISFLTAITLHEFMHLFTLKFLGGDGYIVFYFDFSSPCSTLESLLFPGGKCVSTEIPATPYADIYISLMGGLGSGIAYLILALLIGRVCKEKSIEAYIALPTVSLAQLSYASFETLYAAEIITKQLFIRAADLINCISLPASLLITIYAKYKLLKKLTPKP